MDRRAVPFYAASTVSALFVAWAVYRMLRYGVAPDSMLPVFAFFAFFGMVAPLLAAGLIFDEPRADGAGLGLVGLVFFAAGLFAVQDMVRWRMRSQTVPAVVVDVVELPDTPGPGEAIRRR